MIRAFLGSLWVGAWILLVGASFDDAPAPLMPAALILLGLVGVAGCIALAREDRRA